MNKEFIFTTHRIDLRGGQERSMHENLKRLAENGYYIHFFTFQLEDWPSHLAHRWHQVPGKNISIQLIRNFWFSFYTFFALFNQKIPIITIGTASWVADIRVIQFIHLTYQNLAKKNLAPLPNAQTKFRLIYQKIISHYNSLLERFLFPKTKAFVAISNCIKNEILEITGNRDIPIQVIHHAPDKVEIKNKEEFPLRVLFVGALERKGIEKSLRLLSQVNHQDWFFDVVGPGDITYWEKYAKSIGISSKVKFHGMKPSFEFFAKSHLFLFPSTYEPFGLVVSEAASFECLPLASSECGAMELWQKRSSWLQLSALDDDQKWINAIETVMNDRSLLENLSKESFDAFTSWSWAKSAQEYDRFLQKTL